MASESKSRSAVVMLGAMLLVSVGCGSDNGGSNGKDAGGTGGSGGGGGGSFMSISPCTTQASYTVGTTISIAGTAYDPPCLRASVGSTLNIAASGTHPLSARSGGSANNPIPSQSSAASVTFSAPGFYPFHCTVHQPTMAGVVWVE